MGTGYGGCEDIRCGKGGCEEEGQGLVQVEGRDSRQSEMNIQCEQFISTSDLLYTYQHTHTCMHIFLTRSSCVRSHNVGTAK